MAPVKLPRTNRVIKRLAGGRVAIFWYRRRGETPAMMKFEGDSLGAALAAERDGVDDLVAAYNAGRQLPETPATVRDLVTRFRAAPDGFLKLREGSTRKHWAPWLDRITEEFGDLPVGLLKAKGVRRDVIAWRNRWAATPRTADYAIQVLRRLLAWAVENDLAEANPADRVRAIYASNRADVIVEPAELAEILKHATLAGQLVIRLAAATGMRRGDLLDLRWTEVGEFHIERAANKSTTGRRLLVPLIADARAAIAELRALNKARKVPSTHVLVSARGPWTAGGMDKTWQRAAGPDGANVDKHFNDLRGTACTRFYLTIDRVTDEEVADIMAWEPERCRAIRKRYVDTARIAKGLVARIESKEGQT